MSLDFFFNPKSIAVIGASNNKLKLGYEVFKNLKTYEGRVYPVNIRESVVQGVKAYRSVLDVPDEIDLAVIVIPRGYVKQAIIDCCKAGVKGAIVITGGFSETGAEGKRLEEEIVGIAREHGLRIIGPNCVGVMNTSVNLNATFIMSARKGYVAFISQSGALGAGIIYKTVREGIGFSKFVSVGNMADVSIDELIDYLADDEETKAIAVYLEGLRSGRRFIEACRRVYSKKPVIVLKGGVGVYGSRATQSHTGSLAGSPEIYNAAFKQARVIVSRNVTELLSMSRAFTQPRPRGSRVAVITNAGGVGVLVTDELERRGLVLARFSSETINALRRILPPIAAVNNPVDMIASARGREYYLVTKTILRDNSVDAVIVACVVPTFAGMTPTEHAEGVLKAIREARVKKPVIGLFMAGEVSLEARKLLENNGIPVYETPEEAASAIEALCKHSLYREV